MKEEDKKKEKTDDGTIHEHIIKNSPHINIYGSIVGVNTGYNLSGEVSAIDILGATTLKNDYLGRGVFANPNIDISTHEAIYAGTQPLTLATQAGILGVNALGENLLEMKIKTISDARNFMVGVNNVASVFSENSGLLHSIESASAVAMNHSRLMTEAMDRIDMPSITRGIELATEYRLKANEVIKLSESVTTVLAYGQAVQNQFNVLTDSDIFKNGATVLRDSSIALGKISDHIPAYVGSEYITSPFVFEPRTVKTKEVEKALPEVKKDLPIKTTEAIELMEYVFDQSTKNDDKLITIAISEAKRAVKNIIASSAMLIQQTTQKVEVTAMPPLQVSIEKSTISKNGFPHKLPAGTKWENFTITFLNDENVFIQVKQFTHNASYKDMGFIGKGNDNPSEAWTFLKVLAKLNGELTLKDPEAKDKYKKQKEFLAKTLQDYFTLEYDPFFPYQRNESYTSYDSKTKQKKFYSTKEAKSYRIKITLIPSPQSDNMQSDTMEEKDDLGLKEYLDEQTPQVDDSETHF